MIAVVAIILLGPDRLPQVARQVGAAWRSFNEFRHRMEAEVRTTMPDLPPTTEIARLARSPSALLNKLSAMSDGDGSERRGRGSGRRLSRGRSEAGAGAGRGWPRPGGAVGDTAAARPRCGGGARRRRPRAAVATGCRARPARAAGSGRRRPTPDPTRPAPAAPEVIMPGDPTLN